MLQRRKLKLDFFLGKTPISGSIFNAAAILAGGLIGYLLRSRLKARYVDAIMKSVALSVILLGVMMGQRTQNFLILTVSLVLGTLIGELIDIDGYLERLSKSGNIGESRNIQTFVSTSILFCAGSMAILGGIEEGLGGYPSILATKSVMDFSASIAFGASLGIGVLFSAIPVIIYQGGITLLASVAEKYFTKTVVDEIGAVGGILLFGIGLSMLEIKKIRVCNMLPAVVIAAILASIL